MFSSLVQVIAAIVRLFAALKKEKGKDSHSCIDFGNEQHEVRSVGGCVSNGFPMDS